MQAETRKEKLLTAISDGEKSGIVPYTRQEKFLSYIAGETDEKPTPITRIEMFLDKIERGGSGGGGASTPTQEKTVDITENGTVEVTPDEGYALSKVTANVNVESGGEGGTSDKFKQMVDGTITEVTAADLGEMTKIAPYAFAEKDALVSVEIPESVTEIGNNAFSGCGALASITIPKNMSRLGNYSFSNSKIESITFENVGIIADLGVSSFQDCKNLLSVYIDDLTGWCRKNFGTSVGSTPMYYGANLYLNNSIVSDLVIPENLTKIGSSVLRGCTSLENVTMHDGVTSVGQYAFMNCTNLASVKLSSALTAISREVFAATGITRVSIPDSVTSIEQKAFENCTSLANAVIGAGVKTIASQAFEGCTALSNVEIGASITSIANNAFNECANLMSVTVKAITPPTITTSVFTTVPTNCAIYVPAESVDAYKASTNWSARADYIFAIEEDA